MTTVIDRAKPIASKLSDAGKIAGVAITSITTKPPTRRQKFMSRMKKMGPMLILGGIGAFAGIKRRRVQSSEDSK